MREHREILGTRREAHDVHNQTLEANLDYVIDRMRQSSTPEVHCTV